MFKTATDILEAGYYLLGRKFIVGFLLDKAQNDQGNKAGKDMSIYSVFTGDMNRPNIQIAFRNLEVILDIRQTPININYTPVRHF
jgi:hypothetical protein